ncbi:hypothetical protein M747DRAFT_317975 [Aspergillus niger ATCC 13496]|uniref:Contig An11c0250, genomic contig n=3 Tax=Aspergillus niger TaxID=5061 RepID=A2QX19_ASPNC|nr:uncharacterized protein An11g07280 [Aspergillus niger]RDH16456.1 hypothetical protein M747DRAFT_317975 [Aspergillus niger ATCC 13496]CAK40775.1 unnamed protein product [Aspergillus niger]
MTVVCSEQGICRRSRLRLNLLHPRFRFCALAKQLGSSSQHPILVVCAMYHYPRSKSTFMVQSGVISRGVAKWRYYIVYAVIGFGVAFMVYFLFPETKGRSLEEMDRLFEDPGGVGGRGCKDEHEPYREGLIDRLSSPGRGSSRESSEIGAQLRVEGSMLIVNQDVATSLSFIASDSTRCSTMSAPKWLSLDLALSPQHGWMLSVKAGNQIAGLDTLSTNHDHPVTGYSVCEK